MSKQRSILVATLLVGIVVLVLSRLFQDSPSVAPAELLAAGGGAAQPSDMNKSISQPGIEGDGSRFSNLRIIRTPFPTDLTPLQSGQTIRDVFSVPIEPKKSTDLIDPPTDLTDGTKPPPQDEAPPVSAFATAHRLTAVMHSASSALVLVDEVWLEIGDSMDGCVLKRIEAERAVFDCPEGETPLTVSVE